MDEESTDAQWKKALASVQDGKPGIEQKRNVRGKLMHMEKVLGWVEWKDEGWHLTDKGRQVLQRERQFKGGE